MPKLIKGQWGNNLAIQYENGMIIELYGSGEWLEDESKEDEPYKMFGFSIFPEFKEDNQ